MSVFPGESVTLSISTNGGSSYTELAQVISIDGPSKSVEERDITTLGSTARSYRVSKIQDYGEVSLSIFFDPDSATHELLEDLDGTVYGFKLSMTDGESVPSVTEYTFDGIAKEFAYGGMTVDSDGVTADVTIRITGAVTKS